jgi:hypothetical protein
VQITAVPSVAEMVGVNRILRGKNITSVLGDSAISLKQEKKMRREFIMRAIGILQTDDIKKGAFTLNN